MTAHVHHAQRSADSLGSASTSPRQYGPARNPVPASIKIPCDRGQWTETTIEALRTLWDMGYATKSIGEYIGFTKNATVGKAHRLDLPARPSPIIRDGRPPKDGRPFVPRTPRSTLPPLPSVAAEPHGVVVPLAIPRSAIAAPRPSRAITAAVPPILAHLIGVRGVRPEPVPIERVQATPKPKPYARIVTCLWPIGEPCTKEFRFCDVPSEPGRPYCEEHVKIAYVKIRNWREDYAPPVQPEAAD